MSLPGSFQATKKDGTIYYRSSITYKNKHISLGSFSTDQEAHLAYVEANTILSKANNLEISDTGINLKTDIEKVREQIQNIE